MSKHRKFFLLVTTLLSISAVGFGCNMSEDSSCWHAYISTGDTATCTTGGEIEHVCKYCGDSYIEVTKPKGHSFEILEDTAGCLVAGTKTWGCTKCTHTYTEDSPATGHIYNYSGFCKSCQKYEYDIRIADILPLQLKYSYTGTGHIYSKCEVTKVTFSGSYRPEIHFSGKKTYDEDGEYGDEVIRFTWVLKDLQGNVVDSGSSYKYGLVTGQNFEITDKIEVSLSAEETYVLEIVDKI